MLVTKREVKQTSKKLLSVLLALVMMMTSMSVCFGTFVASAEDVDHMQNLADKLNDSAYSTTLGLLAAGKDSGSGVARKVNISFGSYTNYKQAAELLRLLDSAARTTDAWSVASQGGTDQQSACTGKTTKDLYDELIKSLAKKQVNTDDGTNVQKFLRLVYTWDGAVLHSGAVKSSSQSAWSNTVTFSTTDIKGYLAQVGKAANVISSVELGVQYVVKMQGDLYYSVAGDCNTSTKYYHHMLWLSKTAISAPATSSSNTEAYTKVQNHITELNSFINLTYDQLLAQANAGTLDATIADYNSKKAAAVTYVGSDATYASLFADYQNGINNFLTSAQSAKDFQKYMPTVDNWNDFVDANPDYGTFQYPNFGAKGSATQVKLLEDFATFKAYYDYLVSGGDIYTYLIDNNYINETYYNNFYDNVVAYDLQDSKDAADALYLQYAASAPAIDVVLPTVEEKTIVYSQLCGYINAIGGYSSQVVNAVYTDGYLYLVEFRESLKCDINEAVLYFAENADKSFVNLSTSALWDKINEARGKSGEVNALYEEVKAIIGQTKADELLQASKNAATKMIEGLYQTLAARFTTEVNNAWDVYVALGKPTALKVDTFLQLSAVMVSIEPDILTDLQAAGKAGYITQTTIDRYNELMKVGGIYEIWNAYASTYGFPDYKQTQLTYADRQPMEGDELKTSADPVTEAEMNKLITALDTIITSDLVGDLLGGLLGAEEGEEFNLGAMLTDLIKGALFTDDFINTVVQMLYPLVLGEFAKVWATLPTSIEYSGMDVTVRYKKSLNNILDEGNFEIYPDLLAQKLIDLGYSTKYAENIANLKAAGGENDAWESPKLVDYDTGKLKLSWGVTEQKEKLDAGEITQAQFDAFFYQAFEDATAGLLPLLTTLITNKAWEPSKVSDIATGGTLIVTLDVALQLGSTPNHGYANLLVPIYELLGVPYTPVSTIESSTYNSDVSYVLEQILAPIFAFLDKLGEAPITTILEVLPDLVYALAFRMAKPLLNMLNTTITYDASASLVGSVLADGALIEVGNMLITDEEDALLPESMFAGGLNTILAHFGLNIPAIDQATLATLGKLETMSTGRLASIYSGLSSGQAYTIKADKADVGYYLLSYILNIVKDPDSLAQILGIFMTQKDENGEALKDSDGKSIPDTEAIAALQETMYADDGLNLDEINVGNAIAAIVELANQVEYDVGEYVWYDGTLGTPLGQTPAAEVYLDPNNDWTEEKAEYLYKNLENILYAIFSMAGLDLDDTTEEADGTIEGALNKLLGDLFTGKTVTSLAKLLGSLSDLGALLAGGDEEATEGEAAPEAQAEGEEAEEEAGLDIAEILNDLLVNELGIDLATAYGKYANIAEDVEVLDEFADVNDAESFADALVTLLTPLNPVLDFILAGKDLTLIDSAITLIGYEGYNNALIPLLEALGATPAAYTEGANALELTLDALVSIINKLTTNDPTVANDGAIYTIIDILPGVLYYISSNALSQGVDKLLTPVYAILDTIRPIYNLNLNELLAGIEIGEEGNKKPLGLDLKNLTWSFIFGLLNDLLLKDIDLGTLLDDLKVLIYDVSKIVGTEYESVSTLESTWKKGAYSDEFTQADLLTVILSFVLDWATVKENAEKLDALLNTNGIITALETVFADIEITYGEPSWMYWFDGDEAAFEAYLDNPSRINTLATLDWDQITDNDWDLETAQYFAENIGELVDKIIAMINKDKADAPQTLSALLNGLVNDNLGEYFTDETINDLIGMIQGVLANVDDVLLDIGYELLNVDLVGLKNYKCDKEITTLDAFLKELGYVLDKYAAGLIDILFFGDDIRLAKKPGTEGPVDTIVINGGLGYEKGLAMILEALGCDVPDADKATATNVLEALADRVDEILKASVNEILDLLPNLVYFLNANGAGVAVNNLLAPVNALITKINALGLLKEEIDLNSLLTVEINGEKVEILKNLQLANVVEIVEGATGLPLDAAEAILVNFCTGKITEGKFIYKMEAAREDVITILLYVALELISDDAFAAKLDEMLGTDFIAGIKNIFAPSNIEYDTPDWDYSTADNGTVDAMKYSITYPNNWNEETAEYVTDLLLSEDFDKLIAGLIEGGKYESISALLKDKVNIFTTKTLEDLIGLIKGFLGGVDAELLELGFILDVDLNGLMNHEVKADINDVKAFAAELSTILSKYAPGVVEWLLLGRDYKLLVKDNDGIGEGLEGEAYITISGAEGYKKGLAILLEALGCENLPEADGETSAIIEGVLTSLAARIDEILSDPIVEVIDLLPNLFYFLNTNGVAVAVKNTTAALTALSEKINVFVDINLDVASMVNLKELLKLPAEAKLSMTDLSMAAVLEAVGMFGGLDLTHIEEVLVGFALGKYDETYKSVSGDENAKKMVYADEFDKHDLVTVVANLALITLADEANADFLKGLVGEDVYAVIMSVLAIEEGVPYVYAEWLDTDKADSGDKFSALGNSDYTYGPNYTEKEAQYIADNFGVFVDNVINLLGIQIDGEYINGLSDLLTDLIGGGLYNSGNVIAIRDAIAGLLDGIATLEVNGVVVGGYIVEVLKKSLGVDITAVGATEVPEFEEDKAQFIKYLAEVLDPLGPILNWLLTGKEIAFFTDLDKTDFVRLPGAKGYQNGIVLLLEALDCEGIVDPATLDVDSDGAELVIAIVEPLLNRLDEIIANPADEIFAILPNLVYFINSKGLDVVVKNTLNSVYTVLNAIEPIAKIDLYALVGDLLGVDNFDKAIVDFDLLLEVLLGKLEVAGFSFEGITGEDLAGLTSGVLVSYTSYADQDENGGKKAYKMVYGGEEAEADMVTAVLRLIIKFVTTEGNQEAIVALLESIGMTAEGKKYVSAMIEFLARCVNDTKLGMDSALYAIYYIYYGIDKGASEAVKGKDELSAQWVAKLEELNKNAGSEETKVGDLITDIFDIIFNDEGNIPEGGGNDVLDQNGVASNGLIAFFQRIAKFFQEIGEFFKNLFSFGR